MPHFHLPLSRHRGKIITFAHSLKPSLPPLPPILDQLPCSLIQERIASDQLLTHLESQKRFIPCQACYRKGLSTQAALLGVFDDIRKAVGMRKVTLLTLFDFSKAFDCIPHKKLLSKIRKYNISDNDIEWFYSFIYLEYNKL